MKLWRLLFVAGCITLTAFLGWQYLSATRERATRAAADAKTAQFVAAQICHESQKRYDVLRRLVVEPLQFNPRPETRNYVERELAILGSRPLCNG